jgi:hypothetical protein
MNDPERLLRGGSLLERELLESASSDAGSDAAYRRVQQVIGTAAAIGVASSSASANGAALGAGKVKAAAYLLFGKWLAIGATAGTVVAGTAYVALGPSRSAPERHEQSSLPRAAPPLITAPPITTAPAASEGGRGVAEAKSPADAPPGVLPSHATAPPALLTRRERPHGEGPAPAGSGAASPATDIEHPEATPPAKRLAEEVYLVDTARAALARNDPEAALAVLARHRAEFPAGALRVEVAVLGVRALLGAGRRAEAEREGSRVLAAHPTGPYAERVRALLAGREKP